MNSEANNSTKTVFHDCFNENLQLKNQTKSNQKILTFNPR